MGKSVHISGKPTIQPSNADDRVTPVSGKGVYRQSAAHGGTMGDC